MFSREYMERHASRDRRRAARSSGQLDTARRIKRIDSTSMPRVDASTISGKYRRTVSATVCALSRTAGGVFCCTFPATAYLRFPAPYDPTLSPGTPQVSIGT